MSFSLRYWYKQDSFKPVMISLGLHALAILAALFLHVSYLSDRKHTQSQKSFHLNRVIGGSAPLIGQGGLSEKRYSKTPNSAAFKSPSPKGVPDVSMKSLLDKKDKGIRKIAIENTGAPVNASKMVSNPMDDLKAMLTDTEERQSSKENLPERKKSAANSELARVTGLGQPASQKTLIQNLMKPLGGLQWMPQGTASLDPEEGMPGFTPAKQGGGGGTGFGFSFDQGSGFGESSGDVVKYESLDDFMDIEVYTYQDPKDSQKYYMIKVFAKKGTRAFSSIPKEIIFTIDASLSVSKDRLDEVKRGIIYCLSNLNKDDVFNIAAFKDKTIFFSPQSVSATPDMIKKAGNFVQTLEASEQTDVYAAFKKIVQMPLARVPSNVILISDGRPTSGLVDSREVINEISRINGRVRPIFTFSGGAKVNRYLLDFVSYQNRAWSQFVKKSWDIHTALGEFYDKIKDPLFLNLRFRLNSLDDSGVYPKSLPDFYNNTEFTLYGTYTDEDKFSMQLLGDVDGKTKELVFSRALSAAKKGSDEIMRGYAFNKIYYLISELTRKGGNPALVKEIKTLGVRYDVPTPYSEAFEKTD